MNIILSLSSWEDSVTNVWKDSVLSLVDHKLKSTQPTTTFAPWWVFLIVFSPIILLIGYWIYRRTINKKWENGIFPANLRFNRDNLMEAYICLAAKMIQQDRREAKEKIAYLNSYFLKNFKENTYNFGDSLSWSFRNPVDHKTVVHWINLNAKDESQRMQILYFLGGICMLDGELVQNEYEILKEITPILGLTHKDLDAIISMYTFKEEKTESTQNGTSTALYKKEKVLLIFGLDANASLEEVKLAYRKLVKIHHPDRFSNESKEQQSLAHERFIKIQEAYEYLESRIV